MVLSTGQLHPTHGWRRRSLPRLTQGAVRQFKARILLAYRKKTVEAFNEAYMREEDRKKEAERRT